MTSNYGTGRVSKVALWDKKPYELLVQLGGALAILLSLVIYLLQWSTPVAAGPTTALVANVLLGGALVLSGAIARRNLMNGAIVAGIVSAILIAFGGQAGTLGGIVGLLGAIVAVASPYMPASKHS